MRFPKKNNKATAVGLILLLGVLIICLVWLLYEIQLDEIDNNIRRIKAE